MVLTMYAKPHIAPITARTALTNGKRRKIIAPIPLSDNPITIKMTAKSNINDVANAPMQNESRALVFFIKVMNAFMEIGIMTIYSTARIQKSICQSRYKKLLRNIGIKQNIPMYTAMATRIMRDIWLPLLRSSEIPPCRFFLTYFTAKTAHAVFLPLSSEENFPALSLYPAGGFPMYTISRQLNAFIHLILGPFGYRIGFFRGLPGMSQPLG
jgi:hypothetical protein